MDPASTATIDDINNIIETAEQQGGSQVDIGQGLVITPSRTQVAGKLENNRWFSAVSLCIYGDNHARVVPYFESCMEPLGAIHDE